MKRIFLLLTVVAMTAFTSCSSTDDRVDSDTIAEVFEIRNVNFTAAGNYGIFYDLVPAIFNSDMVLVYRLSGSTGGNDVWQQLPKTIYFEDGSELDYNFDFTINDINIFMTGSFDLAQEPGYTNNQLFRVVVIPGYLSNKSASAKAVDFSDYKAVVKAYGLNDSNVKVLSPSVK